MMLCVQSSSTPAGCCYEEGSAPSITLVRGGAEREEVVKIFFCSSGCTYKGIPPHAARRSHASIVRTAISGGETQTLEG